MTGANKTGGNGGTSPGRLTDHISLGVLTSTVHHDLVDEVPAETGRVENRTRKPPARVMVYYMLAM
ncbi:transposase domain-containing protein [Frankia sp. R82]|nr:transposase domain-containing protein [Frankia sp. R82]MCM3882247.1 transposase domain-containing protein [Frankia sp. R82]